MWRWEIQEKKKHFSGKFQHFNLPGGCQLLKGFYWEEDFVAFSNSGQTSAFTIFLLKLRVQTNVLNKIDLFSALLKCILHNLRAAGLCFIRWVWYCWGMRYLSATLSAHTRVSYNYVQWNPIITKSRAWVWKKAEIFPWVIGMKGHIARKMRLDVRAQEGKQLLCGTCPTGHLDSIGGANTG